MLSGSFMPIYRHGSVLLHATCRTLEYHVYGNRNKLSCFFFSWHQHDAIQVSRAWNKCIARDTFVACKSALSVSLVYCLEQEQLVGISLGAIFGLFSCWLGNNFTMLAGWELSSLLGWELELIQTSCWECGTDIFFPSNKEK